MFWLWLVIFILGLISVGFYRQNVENALKTYKLHKGEDVKKLKKTGSWAFILMGLLFIVAGFLGMIGLFPKK